MSKIARLVGHIGGPSGSGKTTTLEHIQQRFPHVVTLDLDEQDNEAERLLGYDAVRKRDYSNGMLASLAGKRQELLDDFLAKNQAAPVVLGGHHTEARHRLIFPNEGARWALSTPPMESAKRALLRSEKGPPEYRRTPEELSQDHKEAISVTRQLRRLGYARTSSDEILASLKKEAGLTNVLSYLRQYLKHSALNAGQAARDLRYLGDFPGEARGLASVKKRLPSLANNLKYTLAPPTELKVGPLTLMKGHHSVAELKDMDRGSTLAWFKRGYAPWKHLDPRLVKESSMNPRVLQSVRHEFEKLAATRAVRELLARLEATLPGATRRFRRGEDLTAEIEPLLRDNRREVPWRELNRRRGKLYDAHSNSYAKQDALTNDLQQSYPDVGIYSSLNPHIRSYGDPGLVDTVAKDPRARRIWKYERFNKKDAPGELDAFLRRNEVYEGTRTGKTLLDQFRGAEAKRDLRALDRADNASDSVRSATQFGRPIETPRSVQDFWSGRHKLRSDEVGVAASNNFQFEVERPMRPSPDFVFRGNAPLQNETFFTSRHPDVAAGYASGALRGASPGKVDQIVHAFRKEELPGFGETRDFWIKRPDKSAVIQMQDLVNKRALTPGQFAAAMSPKNWADPSSAGLGLRALAAQPTQYAFQGADLGGRRLSGYVPTYENAHNLSALPKPAGTYQFGRFARDTHGNPAYVLKDQSGIPAETMFAPWRTL